MNWAYKIIRTWHLIEFDLADDSAAIRLLETSNAEEVYNLAAQSFVGASFTQPITTVKITGVGALNNSWRQSGS